jgi:hypothetical protein
VFLVNDFYQQLFSFSLNLFACAHTNLVENQGSEYVDSMMKIHVQEDKLHLMNWACREIISSISETADDIYKQEVAMQKKNKEGHLPPLCAIAQVLSASFSCM